MTGRPKMDIENAFAEFERYVSARGERTGLLSIEQDAEVMFGFYRDMRVENCEVASDGDMLLVQWGTYDWGQGEKFEFDLTRQLMLNEEDAEIWQLSMKFKLPPTSELKSFGNGDKWCHSPGELSDFEAFVKQLPPFLHLRLRTDAKSDVTYFQV